MDSFEGAARLEWWANRSTCLAGFGVRVAVRVTDGDWTCDAFLDPPPTAEDREGLGFLLALDPHFTLRFDARSTLPVKAAPTQDPDRLTLTAAGTAGHP